MSYGTIQPKTRIGCKITPKLHTISTTLRISLDTAILEFSSNLRHLGYPTILNNMDDLLKIMEGIKTHVLGGLRLWEFYVLDVNNIVARVLSEWKAGNYSKDQFSKADFLKMSLKEKAKLVADQGLEGAESLGDRFKLSLSYFVAASYVYSIFGKYEESKLSDAERDLTGLINEINLPFYKQFDADRETILENIFNRVKYVRLDLKRGEITE